MKWKKKVLKIVGSRETFYEIDGRNLWVSYHILGKTSNVHSNCKNDQSKKDEITHFMMAHSLEKALEYVTVTAKTWEVLFSNIITICGHHFNLAHRIKVREYKFKNFKKSFLVYFLLKTFNIYVVNKLLC